MFARLRGGRSTWITEEEECLWWEGFLFGFVAQSSLVPKTNI